MKRIGEVFVAFNCYGGTGWGPDNPWGRGGGLLKEKSAEAIAESVRIALAEGAHLAIWKKGGRHEAPFGVGQGDPEEPQLCVNGWKRLPSHLLSIIRHLRNSASMRERLTLDYDGSRYGEKPVRRLPILNPRNHAHRESFHQECESWRAFGGLPQYRVFDNTGPWPEEFREWAMYVAARYGIAAVMEAGPRIGMDTAMTPVLALHRNEHAWWHRNPGLPLPEDCEAFCVFDRSRRLPNGTTERLDSIPTGDLEDVLSAGIHAVILNKNDFDQALKVHKSLVAAAEDVAV